jgi:hypothetical protein
MSEAQSTIRRDSDGRIALSYDYRWEVDQDQPRAMAEWRAREAKRTAPETLAAAMEDAAIRLMRQAAREPQVPSALERARRRYAAACDAYAARIAA